MQRTAWWTAAAAMVALAAGNALAKGPEGESHSGAAGDKAANVGGNPLDKKDNAVEGKGNAHEDNGNNLSRGAEVRRFGGDQGRYHWSSGRWWYWMPSNRWVYYDNGAWQDYTDAHAAPATNDQNYQTTDDRYEFYNGQWWYAMPGSRWIVWGDGRWGDYNGNDAPQRRSSGYRGLPDAQGQQGVNGVRSQAPVPSNGPGQLPHNTERSVERSAPNPGNASRGPASSGAPKGPSGPGGGGQKK